MALMSREWSIIEVQSCCVVVGRARTMRVLAFPYVCRCAAGVTLLPTKRSKGISQA